MKKLMCAQEFQVVSLPRLLATTYLILMMIFTIIPNFNSHPPDVLNYKSGIVSRYVPMANESIPAIGWSEDIRLTNDSAYSVYPDIALEGNNIHVVWENYSNETGEWKYYLMYKRSTDGGLTWDDGLGNVDMARILVDLGDLIPVVSAQIEVNKSIVHIAFYGRHGNFWWPSYMNSTNNGQTWSEPKMIGNKTDGDPGVLNMVAYETNVHIIWLYGSNPLDFQVYYSMSFDAGVTWSNATKMTSILNGVKRPGIAVEGDNVHLAYVERDNHRMYYKRSLDNGKSWDDGLGNIGSQRLLFSDMINLSLWPFVAVSDGRVHIAWDIEIPHSEWNESLGRWIYTPYYQMLYINSEDDGGNWNEIHVLVDHTDIPINLWGDEPSGHIVSSHDIEAFGMNVYVFSGDTRADNSTTEIYYKKSNDGGHNWTKDIRLTNVTGRSIWPRAGIDDEQIHVIWIDGRDDNNPFIDSEGEIYYKRYPDWSLVSAAPTNLSAELSSDSKDVVITWNLSVDDPNVGLGANNIVAYDVYYSTAYDSYKNGYAFLGSVSAGTNTYFHENVAMDGNNYFYYIAAVNDNSFRNVSTEQVAKFTRYLTKGINLISVPLILNDNNSGAVLKTLNYNSAWYYDSLDSSDPWKLYNQNKSYNDLSAIDYSMGIFVDVNTEGYFTVAGRIPSKVQVNLRSGWNLIGYPSFIRRNVGNALSAIPYERIEGYADIPPQYLKLCTDSEFMIPGYGYWVKMSTDASWTLEN